MQTLPSTLYKVQTLEIAIDRSRERLDEIEDALANDERVVAAKKALEESQTALNQTEGEVRNLEMEIAGLAEKIEEVDTLLYSGKIKNPKELQERQQEVESLRRRREFLQERLADTEKLLAQQQAETEEQQQTLQDIQEERQQENVELVAEQKELKKEVKNKLRERKSVVKQIPDSTYKQYRTIRKKKGGIAVAHLESNFCDVCKIEQNSSIVQQVQQMSDELVFCENCGRILFVE
jgi:predicted  nucleic acid-binding Zn-ribbon protein